MTNIQFRYLALMLFLTTKRKYQLSLNNLLLAIFIFCGGIASAQNGTIFTDSSSADGLITDQGIFKNNREVRFSKSKNQPYITYLPTQIKGYEIRATEGSPESGRYLSKLVQSPSGETQFFLLELVKGKATLYMLKLGDSNVFYGQSNGELVVINDGNVQAALTKIFGDAKFVSSKIKHDRNSLSRAFNDFNAGHEAHFRAFTKGIYAGVSTTSFSMETFFRTADLGSDGGAILGAFIEFPISNRRPWSLNVQFYYQKNEYSGFYYDVMRRVSTNYVANISSLNIPILLKHHFSTSKARPFISVGPVVTTYLQRDNKDYNVKDGQSTITASVEMPQIEVLQFGAMVAPGIEVSLNKQLSLLFDFRFHYGSGLKEKSQQISSLQFTAGIQF